MGKQRCPSTRVHSQISGAVGHVVVVLKAAAQVEKTLDRATNTAPISVHERMTHDLLGHELHHIVHLRPRGHRMYP